MATKQYLLKIGWNWDHPHEEVATFSIESWEGMPFEEILSTSRENRDTMISQLKKLADNLTGIQMIYPPSNKLLRLYEVERTNIYAKGAYFLCLLLNPICDFDPDGNPIPPKSHVTSC